MANKPLGHGLDLIDQHIDLKRRVARLEATRLGRDAVKALRSRHPFPVAEHLCIGSSMPTDAYRAGQVARFIAAREQQSSDINIHRLLRVLRERLNINRWIGNQGVVSPFQPVNTTSLLHDIPPPGTPAWTGDLTGLVGGTGGAPPRKGTIMYTQYGNWLYPWVLPGAPRVRMHISKVTSVHDHWRPPVADASNGLVWPNINVKWLAWPQERAWGVSGTQHFPVDCICLCDGALQPQEFGYARGPSHDWGPDPNPPHTALVIVANYDYKNFEAPPQLEVDTQDKILHGQDHTIHDTAARTVQPDDFYSEESTEYTSKAFYFPTDQIKAAGPPYLMSDGPAATNFGGDGYVRAWTQASFADVAANHFGELEVSDMSDLFNWYFDRLSEVPAGEWLADANDVIAPPTRQTEQHITYDHQWTDLAHDGGAGGLPYITSGEGEYLIRNGQVHLRGVMYGDVGMIGPAVPAVPQWFVLIGASGATYHIRIDASGTIHNPSAEPYLHLDSASYHLD